MLPLFLSRTGLSAVGVLPVLAVLPLFLLRVGLPAMVLMPVLAVLALFLSRTGLPAMLCHGGACIGCAGALSPRQKQG